MKLDWLDAVQQPVVPNYLSPSCLGNPGLDGPVAVQTNTREVPHQYGRNVITCTTLPLLARTIAASKGEHPKILQ